MNSIDLVDDLIIFTIDSLGDNEDNPQPMSDLSAIDEKLNEDTKQTNKMSDIKDLLDLNELNDKQENIDFISRQIIDYSHSHSWKNEQDVYEKYQWESEENYLKYGSKQLSPSDYLTRTSLYNRPVAFEKDSRVWARSLLDNFKKTNQNLKTKTSSTPVNFAYYYPIIKKSSSFDRHIEYIEHLNECNDYPAYLEYLRENRSQLFYTLTDSIDVIDGLIGTVVSSF